MTTTSLTVTRLADLRTGDRIVGLDGRTYARALVVTDPLGFITPGSPVEGVRLDSTGRSFEHVLYPSQWDGRAIQVQRGTE